MSVITDKASILKKTSPLLAATSVEARNNALLAIKAALIENSKAIFEANASDVKLAEEKGEKSSVIKRLIFNQSKLDSVLAGLDSLVSLPDPLERVLLKRELDTGLTLNRISCPIGVIGVIFEARPDALVQIASLCIKSGNCCILKGGSETFNTNAILFKVINEASKKAIGLSSDFLAQASERSEISELLGCDKYVDLLIPRGSNSFVRYIMDNTRIPVMGHADGVCHIYVDEYADNDKAVKIIVDAKTQYVAVCNAVETVLVNDKKCNSFLPVLVEGLRAKNVKIRGDRELITALEKCGINTDDVEEMGENDFHTEYLDYTVSLKTVRSTDEAIDHINRFGSHHTDCIITENQENCNRFMQLVDSANVYLNCSTRFADGFRYGFGAEVGVSTSKLHARGPVGLEGLVTYKYRLFGDGHIVADYIDGTKKFHFKDM